MPPPPAKLNTLAVPLETSNCRGGVPAKRTPGRRGEKRKKGTEEEKADAAEKRKRAGKIAIDAGSSADGQSQHRPAISRVDSKEDIFGTRAAPFHEGGAADGNVTASARAKRSRITPTETRNKAVGVERSQTPRLPLTMSCRVCKQSIKKRILHCIEARGMTREHLAFKDIFAVTNKGTSFAFVGISVSTGGRRELIELPLRSAIT
jgi:hypothetical protein